MITNQIRCKGLKCGGAKHEGGMAEFKLLSPNLTCEPPQYSSS